ncbi:MAG: hypothetical protein HY553_08860 [Elusimicrobia bacterium]|nr:hypothetical protein [Elusimicrobiota bacterium]
MRLPSAIVSVVAFLELAIQVAFAQPAPTAEPPIDPPVQPSTGTRTFEAGRPLELPPQTTGQAQLKILESYVEGQTTRIVLQSDRALIVGNDVYAGADESAVNVGTLLTKSGPFWYYSASATGRHEFTPDDVVRLERTRQPSIAERIAGSLDQEAIFAQKYRAQVSAVQGSRALIDKGTMQQVHERDMYRIYNASGVHKGTLEIHGIGDLQSSGKLYSTWWEPKRKRPPMQPGDLAEFVGRRHAPICARRIPSDAPGSHRSETGSIFRADLGQEESLLSLENIPLSRRRLQCAQCPARVHFPRPEWPSAADGIRQQLDHDGRSDRRGRDRVLSRATISTETRCAALLRTARDSGAKCFQDAKHFLFVRGPDRLVIRARPSRVIVVRSAVC